MLSVPEVSSWGGMYLVAVNVTQWTLSLALQGIYIQALSSRTKNASPILPLNALSIVPWTRSDQPRQSDFHWTLILVLNTT